MYLIIRKRCIFAGMTEYDLCFSLAIQILIMGYLDFTVCPARVIDQILCYIPHLSVHYNPAVGAI